MEKIVEIFHTNGSYQMFVPDSKPEEHYSLIRAGQLGETIKEDVETHARSIYSNPKNQDKKLTLAWLTEKDLLKIEGVKND